MQTVKTRADDGGLEIGLPSSSKNRPFFFGAIRSVSVRSTDFMAPAGFPLEGLGDVDRIRDTMTYAAKATWQPTSGQRIDASFFGDPSKGRQRTAAGIRARSVTDTSSASSLIYGGHNQTVHYSGAFGSGWLLEGAFARAAERRIEETPSVDAWRVTGSDRVTPTITTGGIGFFEAGNRSVNRQYALKATNVLGGHNLKYGVEHDDVRTSQVNQRTGPTFTDAGRPRDSDGRAGHGPPRRQLRTDLSGHSRQFQHRPSTTQGYTQLFAQDAWSVSNRLVDQSRIRYEQEKLAGTLVNDFTLKNNWAPASGRPICLTGDGKTKLYGSYGVFYARIPNDLAARSLSADDSTSRADYFDASLTRPIPDGVATIDPGTGAAITSTTSCWRAPVPTRSIRTPSCRTPPSYEIGAQREIARTTTVGVRA